MIYNDNLQRINISRDNACEILLQSQTREYTVVYWTSA